MIIFFFRLIFKFQKKTIPKKSSTLVLKNLPFQLRQETLAEILARLKCQPQTINYHYDTTGAFRGMAFVKYAVSSLKQLWLNIYVYVCVVDITMWTMPLLCLMIWTGSTSWVAHCASNTNGTPLLLVRLLIDWLLCVCVCVAVVKVTITGIAMAPTVLGTITTTTTTTTTITTTTMPVIAIVVSIPTSCRPMRVPYVFYTIITCWNILNYNIFYLFSFMINWSCSNKIHVSTNWLFHRLSQCINANNCIM